MLVDYRTMRHKAKYICFLENSEGVDAAVFSSLGAALRFLELMSNYRATIHGTDGRMKGYTTEGAITLYYE